MCKNLKSLVALAASIMIIFSSLSSSICAREKRDINNEVTAVQLTTEQKLEDFNYMYNILKGNFPYFEAKKRTLGYDWLSHKSEFEGLIRETKDDTEFYYTLKKILCSVQNAHTRVVDPGRNFESLKENYNQCGLEAWKNIFNNEDVCKKNKEWEQKIQFKKGKFVPIDFLYVEGNYIAANTGCFDSLDKLGIPEGSILKEIDSKTPEEYVKSIINRQYLEYDFKRKKLKLDSLLIRDNNKQVSLTLVTPDGKTIKKDIQEMKEMHFTKYNDSKNFISLIIQKNKVAYMKLKQMSTPNEKERNEILNFLRSVKNYPNLIIDIRENRGGYNSFWSDNIVSPLISKECRTNCYIAFRDGSYLVPFAMSLGIPFVKGDDVKSTKELTSIPNLPQELKNETWWYINEPTIISPNESVGFKGKIYLLVDDDVYSASESFAAFAKTTKWATLVGTTTGGDGIGIAPPCVMALPNSKLVVTFSMNMGINPDGTANEETYTTPDIYVEQNSKDFINYLKWQESPNNDNSILNPYDSVLNNILEIIKNH